MAGYIMRQFTCPKAVTHPSTNRARCRATALIETNALPLHQTANPTRQWWTDSRAHVDHCVWGCSIVVWDVCCINSPSLVGVLSVPSINSPSRTRAQNSGFFVINQSINQSVFISGKMPIETNNKQTDRETSLVSVFFAIFFCRG